MGCFAREGAAYLVESPGDDGSVQRAAVRALADAREGAEGDPRVSTCRVEGDALYVHPRGGATAWWRTDGRVRRIDAGAPTRLARAPGDRVILASEGTVGLLGEERLARAALRSDGPEAALLALQREALAHGAPRDLGVLVFDLGDDDVPPRTPRPAGSRDAARRWADETLDAMRDGACVPSLRHLDAVDAQLAGITLPRDAWECLLAADMLPASWSDDPARGFLGRATSRTLAEADAPRLIARLLSEGAMLFDHEPSWDGERVRTQWHPVHAIPSRLHDLRIFAADTDAVATAEALGRELAVRLAPFGWCAPARTLWVIADHTERSLFPALAPFWPRPIQRDLAWELCVPGLQGDTRGAPVYDVDAWLAAVVSAEARWRFDVSPFDDARPHPFGDLPSPFAPLLSIADVGATPLGVSAAGVVLLLANAGIS